MKKFASLFVFAFGAFLCGMTNAAHLVTDPIDPTATFCGFTVDATGKVNIPPATVASLPAAVQATMPAATPGSAIVCWYDLLPLALTAGAHSAKATVIVIDPIWGNRESVASNTVNFTVPGLPGAPSVLRLGQ